MAAGIVAKVPKLSLEKSRGIFEGEVSDGFDKLRPLSQLSSR